MTHRGEKYDVVEKFFVEKWEQMFVWRMMMAYDANVGNGKLFLEVSCLVFCVQTLYCLEMRFFKWVFCGIKFVAILLQTLGSGPGPGQCQAQAKAQTHAQATAQAQAKAQD